MSGAVLAPWPNRTADARYSFRGRTFVLEMNERLTRCASHGLLADEDFDLVSHSEDRLHLVKTIRPTAGYPWAVTVSVEFTLSPSGLTQRVSAINGGDDPAPIGLGSHPYPVVGGRGRDVVDAWYLRVSASQVMLVDEARSLPVRLAHVADEPALDFRAGRRIGTTVVNHAYTNLSRKKDGSAVVELCDEAGAGVEVALDRDCRWVQIYTGEYLDPRRSAIAIEPMTCPPDALNSGRDLRILAPGEEASMAWTIRRLPPLTP